MKIDTLSSLIIFSAFSKESSSYNLSNYISNKLKIPKFNLYKKKNFNEIIKYKTYILIASTMGDQELSSQMENFLIKII